VQTPGPYSLCAVVQCPDRVVEVYAISERVTKSWPFGDRRRYRRFEKVHSHSLWPCAVVPVVELSQKDRPRMPACLCPTDIRGSCRSARDGASTSTEPQPRSTITNDPRNHLKITRIFFTHVSNLFPCPHADRRILTPLPGGDVLSTYGRVQHETCPGGRIRRVPHQGYVPC
jgi:hypothetical protein